MDAFLEKDENAKVAVETLVKGMNIVVAGEVHSNAKVDYVKVIK